MWVGRCPTPKGSSLGKIWISPWAKRLHDGILRSKQKINFTGPTELDPVASTAMHDYTMTHISISVEKDTRLQGQTGRFRMVLLSFFVTFACSDTRVTQMVWDLQ